MTPKPTPIWMVVFLKEFREIFRDRRTTFNTIISPLLITPLLLAMISSLTKGEAKKAQTEKIAVAIVHAEKSPTLMEAIRGTPNLDWSRTTLAEAEEGIRKRTYKAAAVIPEDAEESMADNRTVRIRLLVDEGSSASADAADRLEDLFVERGQRVTAQRLMEQGLSSELANPFQTEQKPVSGGGNSTTRILAVFLPYLLALSAIMGGIYAANDSVAGEKERGTLETLLVSPASRRELVTGKYIAVAGVSLVSSLLSVVGLLWPYYVPIPALRFISEGGLSFTPIAILTLLLIQIPLAVLGAGMLLAISTFARNQKEAQTYLGPVMLIASVAAMLSFVLKTNAPVGYALVPILNAAMVLKQALEGQVNFLFVGIACVASFVYAGLAVVFAIGLFQKEEVLLKS